MRVIECTKDKCVDVQRTMYNVQQRRRSVPAEHFFPCIIWCKFKKKRFIFAHIKKI